MNQQKRKFIGETLAQDNKLIRLVMVERDITNLNAIIQMHQKQIKEIEHRIERAKEKIRKKYEYHRTLIQEI